MVENLAQSLSDSLGGDILYDWDHSKLVKISLPSPDDFLKVKETLTRIGVGNRTSSVLTQSCHILHRSGEYYIVHFKELFRLEGKHSEITLNDIARRNAIIGLLKDWGLVVVENESQIVRKAQISQICVVPFSEKGNWKLMAKHRLGSKPVERKSK